jgi:hypothetical protein
MAHKDYKTERVREGLCEEGWSAPFASLEPVDVCRRSFMFERLEYHINHESEPVPKKEIICRMIALNQILTRRETLKLIEVVKFPRPVIEHKVMMTPPMRAKFEALRQAYEDVASCRCYESETV